MTLAGGLVAPTAAGAVTFTASPSVADGNTTPCSPGPCSLREAITEADASSDTADTILLGAGTYDLTAGQLLIDPPAGTTLSVAGKGTRASDTVISAQGNSRVMTIGPSGTTGTVILVNVEITGGNGTGGGNDGVGGAIYVHPSATLTLLQDLVTANTSSSSGGAIDTNGQLTVVESTISENTVTGGLGIGGGIDNFAENGANTTIINSTFTGNQVTAGSTGEGGAINNGSKLNIADSTIAGNSAIESVGGIAGGGTNLVNSIIAENKGAGSPSNCSDSFTTESHNIADDGTCHLTASGDLPNTDPMLVGSGGVPTLADNGGPTETIALQGTSPAVDLGVAELCATTDQRGYPRPDSEDTGPNPTCDIGAYESGAAAPRRTLTVSVAGTGGGTVTGNGISCPGTCSGTLADGSNVTLTAAPASGSTFAGWSGDCTETAQCGLTMSADHQVTATFSATTTSTTTTSTTTTLPPPTPPPSYDLALAVSHLDPFSAGQGAPYHVLVTNRGTAWPTGPVTVSATLPSGITYIHASGSWSCSPSAGGMTVTCTYQGPPVTPGASTSFDITVSVAGTSSGGPARFTLGDAGDGDSSDKSVTDTTTVVGAGAVATSLTGPPDIYAGATTKLALAVSNQTHLDLPAGVTVEVTVPNGTPPGFTLSPTGSGTAWFCSTIAMPGTDLVHCTYGVALGAGKSAPGLSLSLSASAGSNPTTPVQLSYVVKSAAGAVLAGPGTHSIGVVNAATARAQLALSLHGAAGLRGTAQPYSLMLANTGAGATTSASAVRIELPDTVRVGTPAGDGWSCNVTGRQVACAYPKPIPAGGEAAPLALALAGTPGAASPAPIIASAASGDTVGSLLANTTLVLDQPQVGGPHPLVRFLAGSGPGAAGTARYSLQVTNAGDGPSHGSTLTVSETLPAGVTATATGSGWSCAQQTRTSTCTYAPGGQSAGLARGESTATLAVAVSGASAFAGAAMPVPTSVTVGAGAGSTVTTAGLGHVAVPAAPKAVVVPQATVDRAAATPGATIHVTVGLANHGAGDAPGPQGVALTLPADLKIASAAGTATPDEPLPAPGSSGTAAATPGTPGMRCLAATSNVVCVAPSLPAGTFTTVDVAVTLSSSAVGIETMNAGLVTVAPGNRKAELLAAETAVGAGQQSALGDLTPVSVRMQSFVPEVGAGQHLAVATEGAGGTTTPTKVTLDASKTLSTGQPLTFAWIQTAGPPVTWAPSPPDSAPGLGGSSLPAFPLASFVSVSPGTYGSGHFGSPPKQTTTQPQVYGSQPSFTYDSPRSLTAPATLTFELYVTDGSLVQMATTSVTLVPLPPPPPIAPQMCLWDVTVDHQLTAGSCLQPGGRTPPAGHLIVAGPVKAYTQDAAGHALQYRWKFTQPAVRPPTIGAGPGVPAICSDRDRLCFAWPNRAAVVSVTATITNGQAGAQGQPEQAMATATAGSTPPPPAITISGPTAPIAAGSTVSLTASVPSGGQPPTYDWTQTAGPSASGLTTSGRSVTFTAPAPSGGVSTATFEVKVSQGAGAAIATGTRDYTVTLLPAAPLSATVTPSATSGPAVALSGQLSLVASASGGSGHGYTYAWSVAGGGGTVTPSSGDPSRASYAAGEVAGVASLHMTVTDSAGTTVTSTVSIDVGSVPSFPAGTSSSGPCASGGPLATILSQLSTGAAALTLGPFTLDLGQPAGAAPDCSSIASGATVTFSAANIAAGPFTLSGVSATVSSTGIKINSGTVTAPGNWNLGSASISTPINVPFSGSPSGALTWSGKLPWLALPGASAGATTTVTYAGGTATLTATVPLAGGTAKLTATLPSGGGSNSPAFTANVTVTGGNADGSSGQVVVGSDGTVTPSVTLNLSGLPAPSGVSLSNLTLHWDAAGLTLHGGATLAGSIALTLAGSYQDSGNWSATVTLASALGSSGNPSWLPSGVSLAGATLAGTVTDNATAITFDVKLDLPNAWSFSAGGHQLVQVKDLTAEFSNTTPPSACQALFTSGPSGSVWLALAGNAEITLPGGLSPIGIAASACVSPSTSGFILTTSGFDGFTPFHGVPLTLNGISFTVSYINSSLSISAAGKLTVDGVTAAGTLSLLPDGAIVAVGAIPDLSQLGLPLPGGSSGAVVFSTKEIPDLGSAPASLFAGTGLRQSDYSGVTVQPDSVAVAAAFRLPSSLQCLLDQTIYNNPCSSGDTPPASGAPAAPSAAVVSADIGGSGVPTITATLSAGTQGLTIFDIGTAPNAVSLALNSIDLQIALDGSISIGGNATLTLPTPGASPATESTLQLGVDVAIDATGPSISIAGTVGPSCNGDNAPGGSGKLSALCNLLGVKGLDLSSLSVQLGINFATTPIPTPTFGLAAGITALPCRWEAAIHMREGGCATDSSGNLTGAGQPDPNSPQAEPISLAINVADTDPIFALQLGLPNHHPVLSFGNALSVDDASLVIAPLGGTIGAGPNAVTYAPGFTLGFDATVLNVPMSVHATIDPAALSVTASASAGTISVAGLTIQNAMFDFAVDPVHGIQVGFSGQITLPGGATLTGALNVQATTSGDPSFTLQATGGNIELGPTLTLTNFNLSATGTLAGGALPQLNLEGSATGTLLGRQFALAGGVDITPGLGITGASFYADPGNFTLDGVQLSGQGCGSGAPPGLPSTGPCIGASFDPAAATPLTVTLDASATFNGVGVSFDGTVDETGVQINNASATFVDSADPSGRPTPQTLGQLSGHLWLGSDQQLAGRKATDPNTGQPVQVHNGDFEVQGTGQLSLAGFDLSGSFAFGSLSDGAGSGGGPSVFAHGTLNVDTLGGSMAVSGNFGSDSSGNVHYDLIGDGDALALDGYPLTSVHVELSSSAGLSVNGSLDLGGIVTAGVSGNVNDDPRAGLLYSVSGAGSVNVLGTGVAGNMSITNEDSFGGPLGYVSANAAVNGSFDNLIAFNGNASFATDGTVCTIGGSVTLASIQGSASYCSTDGSIKLDFNDNGFDLSGGVTGSDWSLTAQVGFGSFDKSASALGFSGEVSANWWFDFGVSSSNGLTFGIDGSATASGSVPLFGGGSVSATLSGSPGNVCAGANIVGTDFQACADSHGIHFTKPSELT